MIPCSDFPLHSSTCVDEFRSCRISNTFRTCSTLAKIKNRRVESRERPTSKKPRLQLTHDEVAKLRDEKTKNLLREKKLVLVLDLDHTLVDTRKVSELSSDEEYLLEGGNLSSDDLFLSSDPFVLVKLRPFVRTLLKEASDMFELYIYTKAQRSHAMVISRLLDPESHYFDSRIITRDDRPDCRHKSLDFVLGHENVVLILDDTKKVWPDHQDNLITVEKYEYFVSSYKSFLDERYKSMSEMRTDESETNGALVSILKVVREIHRMFFHPKVDDADIGNRDVRLILQMIRCKVLIGCSLFFSDCMGLWEMAEELGAMFCRELDAAAVTHVVALDNETEEARWAERKEKFLVHPKWVQAAYLSFQKQPEENFPLEAF